MPENSPIIPTSCVSEDLHMCAHMTYVCVTYVCVIRVSSVNRSMPCSVERMCKNSMQMGVSAGAIARALKMLNTRVKWLLNHEYAQYSLCPACAWYIQCVCMVVCGCVRMRMRGACTQPRLYKEEGRGQCHLRTGTMEASSGCPASAALENLPLCERTEKTFFLICLLKKKLMFSENSANLIEIEFT